MWVPADGEAWAAWVGRHRPDAVGLWAARAEWVGRRDQYLNPPLGQFAEIEPETVDPDAVVINAGDAVVVATDGAELERAPAAGIPGLGAYLASVVARTPSPDADVAGVYSFSGIAAIRVAVAPSAR